MSIVEKKTNMSIEDFHYYITRILLKENLLQSTKLSNINLTLKNGTVDEPNFDLATSINITWNEEIQNE